MDEVQEEYGMERVISCVRGVMSQSAGEIVNAVNSDVAAYSRMGTHLDDKVMIAIKIT
jgi:hypothetical protein